MSQCTCLTYDEWQNKSKVETPGLASLRGGLLRLMMTGLIFVTFDPESFWISFFISEIVSYLSTQPMEGLRMVLKASGEVLSSAKLAYRAVRLAWEHHLPYRFNLLMIQ